MWVRLSYNRLSDAIDNTDYLVYRGPTYRYSKYAQQLSPPRFLQRKTNVPLHKSVNER